MAVEAEATREAKAKVSVLNLDQLDRQFIHLQNQPTMTQCVGVDTLSVIVSELQPCISSP